MKKFVVIYHADAAALEQMQQMAGASPEEHEKAMEPWMTWAASCGDRLVDMGAPLVGGQRLSKSGSTPSEMQVVGYSILNADDMQSAQALLSTHPHLEWTDGCSIEVHEAAPMSM